MRIRKFANERVGIGNESLEIQIEHTNRKRTISNAKTFLEFMKIV